MKVFMQRYDAAGVLHTIAGSLYKGTSERVTVYFGMPTPNIGLNDGKFYAIRQLDIVSPEISIDRDSILVNGFVCANQEHTFHKDGFTFYLYDPTLTR